MATPNIIFILADDMGYGDAKCNNPASHVPTPNLDRLADGGMRFTDAHASSSVCTPSRYGVLTGRYPWRSRLKRGIVWEWDGSLIEPDRVTVAELLRRQGYHTAAIGKWHLGWDWSTDDGRHPNETLPFGTMDRDARYRYAEEHIDLAGRIGGGPVDRGFDSYFGVDVPNFPPYAWFEDDHLVELPTEEKPEGMYGHPGPACAGWSLEAMIPEFTRRAVDFITERGKAQTAGDETPYFLYFPLTSPHSPIVPNEQFVGKSGVGLYGDFVCEVDWVVGQVMDALARSDSADHTLLVFTSDNGPENRTPDDEGVYARAQRSGHYSMGDLRGIKRDAWEGGHRIPFIASWPERIPAGTACTQTICLTDFMATCAEIVGTELPAGSGEDGTSILPLLSGDTETPVRELTVHHSGAGKFAIRRDNWVFIDAPTGDENREPDWFKSERGYRDHDQPGELYDLQEDLSERENRYAERPDLVAELRSLLDRVKAGDADPERGINGTVGSE